MAKRPHRAVSLTGARAPRAALLCAPFRGREVRADPTKRRWAGGPEKVTRSESRRIWGVGGARGYVSG